MIVDKIPNAELYYNMNDKIKTALKYIKNNDLKSLRNGKYSIEEDDIFIIIQDYQTKQLEEGQFEAHKKYTDIQYIIEGKERLGYLNIDEFTPTMDFDEEKDIVFGLGKGDFVTAKEDYFILFTPQDAHMPGICTDKPSYVKKAVIKIKAD